jgi:hypothetical protein
MGWVETVRGKEAVLAWSGYGYVHEGMDAFCR